MPVSIKGTARSKSSSVQIAGNYIINRPQTKFMDTPFVCNINALNQAQRERYKEILGKLDDSRQAVKELNDGYAFRYKAESQMILDTAEFIIYERLCCPFFGFELAIEQDTNRLWLRLRGQEGIKEFIRAEFNINED